jgi:hypothetical protein
VQYSIEPPWSGAERGFRTAPNEPINPATDDLGTLYAGYRLNNVGVSLDAGLYQFTRERFGDSLESRFSFEQFPEDFKWPGLSDSEQQDMLNQRSVHVF